jgi:hypothetical protein
MCKCCNRNGHTQAIGRAGHDLKCSNHRTGPVRHGLVDRYGFHKIQFDPRMEPPDGCRPKFPEMFSTVECAWWRWMNPVQT